MKKIVLLLVMLFSVTSVFADDFSDASVKFCRGHYAEAKELLERCLRQTQYKSIYDDIRIHIETCNTRIAEQRTNAAQAAKKRAEKLRQKEANKYYYISVIAPENIRDYAKSMASEVLLKNGINECQKLEDAWMVVTVSLNIHSHEPINGFYAAEGEGFVSVGYADETKSSGFRAVGASSQSPAGQVDAERLVRNKLNHRLAHQLDNIINGRPTTEKIPEQIIALKLTQPKTMNLAASHLCNVMNSYIAKKEGVKLTSALDSKRNAARDENAITSSIYIERDERASVRELKGYNQIIFLDIEECDGCLVFNASLEDVNGVVITNAALDGSTLGITKENFNKAGQQELVAKILAAMLGFGAYKIGDVAYIDKYGREVRFASVDGAHGSLFMDADKCGRYPVYFKQFGSDCIKQTLAKAIYNNDQSDKSYEKEGWRLPSVKELKDLKKYKQFRLSNVYWTSEPAGKNRHKVVDFRGENPMDDIYNDKKEYVNIVAIREF